MRVFFSTAATVAMLSACNDASLTVNNSDPEVTILAPVAGAVLPEGEPFTFEATVSDRETRDIADLTLVWASNLTGTLTGESTFPDDDTVQFTSTLSGGAHTVTLTALDLANGSGEDFVAFTVTPNAAPSVAFTAPVDGSTFYLGNTVTIAATVSDDRPLAGVSLAWSGTAFSATSMSWPSAVPSSGEVAVALPDLPVGAYSIVLEAVDEQGERSQSARTFLVASGDEDGDGARSPAAGGSDCNDANATIFPGATDVVNDGIDQDCDGVDACFTDADNDGYGTTVIIDALTLDCAADEGRAVAPNDCNDTVAMIFPGATEVIADGIDQNCDAVDACYTDADNDGFGAITALTGLSLDCAADEGRAAVATDCDEFDATVRPGAEEICNGIDDDCSAGTPDGHDAPTRGDACDSADDDDTCAFGEMTCDDGEMICADDTTEGCVEPPELAYGPVRTVWLGEPMTVEPTLLDTNGGALTDCALTMDSPALPEWATIDTDTCTLSGVPDAPLPLTAFSVIATNTAGSSAPAPLALRVQAPTTAQFQYPSTAVQEGNGPTERTIRVTLAEPVPVDVTLRYAVIEAYSTAIFPTHTSLTDGTVTVPAGAAGANIVFTTAGNAVPSDNRAAQINLIGSNVSGVRIGHMAAHLFEVHDDDGGAIDFRSVVAGQYHTCAIDTQDRLFCWGRNKYSQLGDGATATRTKPYLVSPELTFAMVAPADEHTCAVTTGNALYCWGRNQVGQLGDNSLTLRSTPTLIDGTTAYQTVATGYGHSCAITTAGELRCWGNGTKGELGDGTGVSRRTPTPVSTGQQYAQVSAGYSHTCAIRTSGQLQCWGLAQGAVGDGTETMRLAPVVIDGAQSYIAVATGNDDTCAVTNTHTLKCWGYNWIGEVGDGTEVKRLSPVIVDAGNAYSTVSAGESHFCGILDDGKVTCWGFNALGQLGDGTRVDRNVPTPVDAGTTYAQVTGGAEHGCGVTSIGTTRCWGNNPYGALGIGTKNERTGYYPIGGNLSLSGLTATSNAICGLEDGTGHVYCWGDAETLFADRGTPTRSGIVSAYTRIDSGSSTCGLTSSGRLDCWGPAAMAYGPSTEWLTATTTPLGSTVVTDFESGTNGTCAVTAEGELYCWNGTYGSSPTLMGTGFVSVIAGSSSTSCALKTGGELHCWGWQSGNGTSSYVSTPTPIDAGVSYKQVAIGSGHACAVTTDGTVKCWGSNYGGAAGQSNTGMTYTTPTPVAGVTATFIAAQYNSTCAINTSDDIVCWGSNYRGHISETTTQAFTTPQWVGIWYTDFEEVVLSEQVICAKTTTDEIYCRGSGFNGTLGYGEAPYLPMAVTP